ncbi:MAG: hypothetical protein P8Y70_01775 [Candidatus Lokiarchaeota archaeon]
MKCCSNCNCQIEVEWWQFCPECGCSLNKKINYETEFKEKTDQNILKRFLLEYDYSISSEDGIYKEITPNLINIKFKEVAH